MLMTWECCDLKLGSWARFAGNPQNNRNEGDFLYRSTKAQPLSGDDQTGSRESVCTYRLPYLEYFCTELCEGAEGLGVWESGSLGRLGKVFGDGIYHKSGSWLVWSASADPRRITRETRSSDIFLNWVVPSRSFSAIDLVPVVKL
jgi:hypothetical protein